MVRRVERTRIIFDLQPHGQPTRPRPAVFSSPGITRPTPDPLDVQLVYVLQRDLSRESGGNRLNHNQWVHALRALMHVCDIYKHDQRVSVQTAAL